MNTTPTRSTFVSVVTVDGSSLLTLSECQDGNRGEAVAISAAHHVIGGLPAVDEFLLGAGYRRTADWETGIPNGNIAWIESLRSIETCPKFDWCEGHDFATPLEEDFHISEGLTLIDHPQGEISIRRVKEQDKPRWLELTFFERTTPGGGFYPSDIEALALNFEAAAAKLRQFRSEVQ